MPGNVLTANEIFVPKSTNRVEYLFLKTNNSLTSQYVTDSEKETALAWYSQKPIITLFYL